MPPQKCFQQFRKTLLNARRRSNDFGFMHMVTIDSGDCGLVYEALEVNRAEEVEDKVGNAVPKVINVQRRIMRPEIFLDKEYLPDGAVAACNYPRSLSFGGIVIASQPR